MKYIFTFTLKDQTKLVCITDGMNKAAGFDTCLASSHRLFMPRDFNQRKFRLDKNTPYKVEQWKASETKGYSHLGNINYSMLMFNGRDKICWQITSSGVKSAYREVVQSLGNIPVTFLYDLGQQPRKKSSKNKAQVVIKDKKETMALLNRATEQARSIPGLGPYLGDIPLMCSMVYDYVTGAYREVPISSIIGATAALIYFVSPIDMIPDFLPVVGQLDDVAVITYAIKALHKDLELYHQWKAHTAQQA